VSKYLKYNNNIVIIIFYIFGIYETLRTLIHTRHTQSIHKTPFTTLFIFIYLLKEIDIVMVDGLERVEYIREDIYIIIVCSVYGVYGLIYCICIQK